MIIFPAIDVRSGRVVRLKQGLASEETVYSGDPSEVAARWQAEGSQWLHVVDLDRALGTDGKATGQWLETIRAVVTIPIQFGGGLRDLESIARAFDLGIDRVVIGTMAVENPGMLRGAVARFGAERIAVALDLQAGHVAIRGWQHVTTEDGPKLGRQMYALGVRRAVVADISRDGMMSGIDADTLCRVASETGLSVIASGGIATLENLTALVEREQNGLEGAIIGRALYEGAFSLGEALELARRRAPRVNRVGRTG